ncbi:hypothetical protein Y888_00145 [Mixta calida B021323]|uniref:Uncharacterized protein n=1 Tax=Mixta calida TaxID=665913 RepID=A0ABN5HDE5_9GAMM|nr:hypothetical protein PSNIH2_00635 [Pantoea sp. PSNIH2]AUY26674.1 hypothetical protein C2E16_18400 [Mixta calida]KAF0861631.1 hypothetical protein Y888_00145 [Mixta calida B021323]POU66116.1 hypothetical protein C3374_13255 [Pantoea sp. PSNIH4]POY68024.1 hypothetical protein C3402_09705 [Pantoea sp. PSNIH3]
MHYIYLQHLGRVAVTFNDELWAKKRQSACLDYKNCDGAIVSFSLRKVIERMHILPPQRGLICCPLF